MASALQNTWRALIGLTDLLSLEEFYFSDTGNIVGNNGIVDTLAGLNMTSNECLSSVGMIHKEAEDDNKVEVLGRRWLQCTS